MSLLSLEKLNVTLRGREVLREVSTQIGAGEFVGLIGPNGAGKTSLMRAALGLIPASGQSSLAALRPSARARQVAWMPQMREIAWPITVERLVALGRLPHMPVGRMPPKDRAHVEAAIQRMQLAAFHHRAASRLSGGEQARALIARALAQDTPLLMADEPVAGLDPAHQIATMQVFAELARAGHAVFVSLHDLGLAARHCTRVILLSEGRVIADGPTAEVMTPELMGRVFGISVWHEATARGPVFQPLEVV